MKSSENNYDIGIIGGGVSGAFAANYLAENLVGGRRAVLFELGAPPMKRRRQLEGWLGCMPFGDGKLYRSDFDGVKSVVGGRRANYAYSYVYDMIMDVNPNSKFTSLRSPSLSVLDKFDSHNFEYGGLSYIQWKPDSVHSLSRRIAENIEGNSNINMIFRNEVIDIKEVKKGFRIKISDGETTQEFLCKKVILCAGRSSWRWVNSLYKDFRILNDNNIAKFGVKIEMTSQSMRELNKSHFVLKRDDVTIGPFLWGGQVIQEDHADMTVASFRSNENRWKSDKVLFSMVANREFKGQGIEQSSRLAGLAFVLSQDRVGRERIRSFMRGDSQLSVIPEYSWMKDYFLELDDIFPNLISRGYFHCPDIDTVYRNIDVERNLQTKVNGLFVAGESAGIRGIIGAAMSGVIAARGVL